MCFIMYKYLFTFSAQKEALVKGILQDIINAFKSETDEVSELETSIIDADSIQYEEISASQFNPEAINFLEGALEEEVYETKSLVEEPPGDQSNVTEQVTLAKWDGHEFTPVLPGSYDQVPPSPASSYHSEYRPDTPSDKNEDSSETEFLPGKVTKILGLP